MALKKLFFAFVENLFSSLLFSNNCISVTFFLLMSLCYCFFLYWVLAFVAKKHRDGNLARNQMLLPPWWAFSTCCPTLPSSLTSWWSWLCSWRPSSTGELWSVSYNMFDIFLFFFFSLLFSFRFFVLWFAFSLFPYLFLLFSFPLCCPIVSIFSVVLFYAFTYPFKKARVLR